MAGFHRAGASSSAPSATGRIEFSANVMGQLDLRRFMRLTTQ